MLVIEFRQHVYDVMRMILQDTATPLKVLTQQNGMSDDETLEVLDYIMRERLLDGMSAPKGGRGNKPLIVFYDRACRTEKGLAFMEAFENSGILVVQERQKPSVFVSYKWDDSGFVDCLEKKLMSCAHVARDKSSMAPWASISKFMQSIRDKDFAILVISDKYLKSTGCMYEVTELMKERDWETRVMFAVLDTAIFDSDNRNSYIVYWQDEVKRMKEESRKLEPVYMGSMVDDLQKATQISLKIGEFLKIISQANNPAIWEVIDKIIERIRNDVSQLNIPNKIAEIDYHIKEQNEVNRLLD